MEYNTGKDVIRMKKLKIYLDTSVISHLLADDVPEKMADTRELWKLLQQGEYEVVISELTFSELLKCSAEKRFDIANYIALINYTHVPITSQQNDLAQEYLRHKVLTDKSTDDLLHIACSVLNNCDYITSWNFKHFVNIKTISKVNSANVLLGFREVKIVPPSMLLGGNTDE